MKEAKRIVTIVSYYVAASLSHGQFARLGFPDPNQALDVLSDTASHSSSSDGNSVIHINLSV